MTRELRTLLELNDDQQLSPSTRTDELGIDSLVAVKLRTWLSSNYEVSIPTLEILGGITLDQLSQKVLDTLPESAIPNVAVSPTPGDDSTSRDGSSRFDEVDGGHETDLSDERSSLDAKDDDGKITPERAPVVRTSPVSFTQTMFWFVQ